MKKWIVALSALIIFSGCSANKEGETLKDTNKVKVEAKTDDVKEKKGSDKSQIELSDYDLSEEEGSGVMVGRSIGRNKWVFKFKKFNGIKAINDVDFTGDGEIEFQCKTEIEKGLITVVFLDEKFKVVKRFDGDVDEKFTMEVKEGEKYYIKALVENGEKGEVSIEIL